MFLYNVINSNINFYNIFILKTLFLTSHWDFNHYLA